MSWAIGSNIQIRIAGELIQDVWNEAYDSKLLKCALELDDLKKDKVFICPSGENMPFFEEVQYLLRYTSSGFFRLTNDLSFVELYQQIIVDQQEVFSSMDMYKVLLFINALGRQTKEEIWFGLGAMDYCILFGSFRSTKFEYVKVKKTTIEPEDTGNVFNCTKEEMDLFFEKAHHNWFIAIGETEGNL